MNYKTAIAVLVGILLWTSAASQPYKSVFSTKDLRYNILWAYCDAFLTDSFVLTSDTTILEKHYNVITQQGPGNWIWGGPPVQHYLREDTLKGRMWNYLEEFGREFLIMDLSLTVGDLFYIFETNDKGAIDSMGHRVSSVFYIDGLKHVRLEANIFQCSYRDRVTFIEGVGPNTGPNMHFYPGSTHVVSYILCMYKGGERVYTGGLYANDPDYPDPCWIYGTDVALKPIQGLDLKIYPNPSSDQITLRTGREALGRMEAQILSLSGIVLESHFVNSETITLSVAKLPKGVYIIRVKLPDSLVLVGKFIKN